MNASQPITELLQCFDGSSWLIHFTFFFFSSFIFNRLIVLPGFVHPQITLSPADHFKKKKNNWIFVFLKCTYLVLILNLNVFLCSNFYDIKLSLPDSVTPVFYSAWCIDLRPFAACCCFSTGSSLRDYGSLKEKKN